MRKYKTLWKGKGGEKNKKKREEGRESERVLQMLGDGVEVTKLSGPPRNPFRQDSVNPSPMIRYLMFHLALKSVVECMSSHHLAPTAQGTCCQSEEKTAPTL